MLYITIGFVSHKSWNNSFWSVRNAKLKNMLIGFVMSARLPTRNNSKQTGRAASLWTSIRDGLSSNLGGIDYPGDFPQSLHTNVGIVPGSGHNRFHPYLLQLIIHSSSYHSTHSLDTGKASLNNHRKRVKVENRTYDVGRRGTIITGS
jgi:hypothetical protein